MQKCPKCGAVMTLRLAEKGKNAGNRFYGCSRYPLCRGIREWTDPNADKKTSLPKNHPFVVEATRLEKLECVEGGSKAVVDGRSILREQYPEYFTEYMNAKRAKSALRVAGDEYEKKRQIRAYGSETVTYSKLKPGENINKNLENEI